MTCFQVVAAALSGALACAAETPATGKWNCTNLSDSGTETSWTLLVRDAGAKPAGILSDGEVQLELSEIKFDAGVLTFRFYVNQKPYGFEGKVDGKTLEGRYKGDEASGKLRCRKAAR